MTAGSLLVHPHSNCIPAVRPPFVNLSDPASLGLESTSMISITVSPEVTVHGW